MSERTPFSTYGGIALLILAVTLGPGGCVYLAKSSEAQRVAAEAARACGARP
ncbi:hypothetical protein [Methylobacterium dankookense]|uniref:hypothetical protein n=1 Tax=Methylobacterium dankookense TaxID=560405 RepID=UPI001643C890|nr:hypothetical protein [Methylobacterium dankookense]